MPTRFFQGAPVASGTIRGRAKIVRDWRQSFLPDPNTVVIVRFPVPKLSPIITHATALLCAYGSPDSFLAGARNPGGIQTRRIARRGSRWRGGCTWMAQPVRLRANKIFGEEKKC